MIELLGVPGQAMGSRSLQCRQEHPPTAPPLSCPNCLVHWSWVECRKSCCIRAARHPRARRCHPPLFTCCGVFFTNTAPRVTNAWRACRPRTLTTCTRVRARACHQSGSPCAGVGAQSKARGAGKAYSPWRDVPRRAAPRWPRSRRVVPQKALRGVAKPRRVPAPASFCALLGLLTNNASGIFSVNGP